MLKGVQVGPLDVFQQTQRGGALIVVITEDGRDGVHFSKAAGTEPPLPGYQLVASIRHFSHRDGLQQTIFTDALGQRSQLLLAELPPCLKR